MHYSLNSISIYGASYNKMKNILPVNETKMNGRTFKFLPIDITVRK